MFLDISSLMSAIVFSARKHKNQRRKGSGNIPYVNHPLEVANLIAQTVGATNIALLAAAVLHDTLEDTRTTPDEIDQQFGKEVMVLVLEVSDDMSQPKFIRKSKQIETAGSLSDEAKIIRIADKTCNILDMLKTKYHWGNSQKREYMRWAKDVVKNCEGVNKKLEGEFENALYCAQEILGDF